MINYIINQCVYEIGYCIELFLDCVIYCDDFVRDQLVVKIDDDEL